MPRGVTAYLSIYDDWDFMGPMLRSIAPYVDDLVVVDGAYAWLADHLSRNGDDPLRSDARVYDALEDSKIPYKVITKLWANEIEKRVAGYAACEGRYVLRIDADEGDFLRRRLELERFFRKAGRRGRGRNAELYRARLVERPSGVRKVFCACRVFRFCSIARRSMRRFT